MIDPLEISKYIPRLKNCEIVAGPGKGLGTVSRWTWDDGQGNVDTWDEEITKDVPNERMSFKYHNYRNIQGTHELKSVESGVEVTFTETHDYENLDPVEAQKDVEHVLITLKRAVEDQ